MYRLSKIVVLISLFVIVFSTGGVGQEAVAAPAQGIFGKTQISGPSDFEVSVMSKPLVTATFPLSTPTHYLINNDNVLAYATATMKFPKGKIAKWVKGFVVDEHGSDDIIMAVLAVVPSKKIVTLLGTAKSSGNPSSIQTLKVTFSQKMPAGKLIIVQMWVRQANHFIYGAQGGYLK